MNEPGQQDETPKELAVRIQETTADICQDMETDTQRWEGEPLTGHNVAAQFGELRATVAALAGMTGKLAGLINEVTDLDLRLMALDRAVSARPISVGKEAADLVRLAASFEAYLRDGTVPAADEAVQS